VSIIFLIIGLLMFVGLVVVHEMGHFYAARRNGVEVEEFGIGFPPRAKVLKKVNGTEYTLNWLPLGGFVKLKGEHDSDTRKGSFGAASLKNKMKIMLAGVLMNILAAVVLFTVIALFGMPKSSLERLPFYSNEQFSVASDTKIVKNDTMLSYVAPDSPAANAGLEAGDEVKVIADETIDSADELRSLVAEKHGQNVEVVYVRGNKTESRTTTALLNDERVEGQGHFGVDPIDSTVFRATWSAPIVGVATTAQYIDVSFRGLGYIVTSLFAGNTEQATSSVGGPVATFKILSDTSSLGILYVLFVIALISVSLAVMNILPIPALDGGRAFVTLLFRALRKPLTQKTEELIHGSGFAFLMVLIVLITVVDVQRFF
jgi:regulator of sigma E protease